MNDKDANDKDVPLDHLNALLDEGKREKILHQLSVSDLPSAQPTVSLHMIVKNAEHVIARTISHVLPYLSEVSIVLNDTDDGTYGEIVKVMEPSNVPYRVHSATSASHPAFYIHDVPETYEKAGPALAREEFLGPCTGQQLLCDWSSVRNLGWGSKAEYKLQLDADDMLLCPESLPVALKAMREVGADLVAAPYHINGTTKTVYRERVARNVPIIKWEGRVHDQLTGGLRRLLCEDLLVTMDMRDNRGTGTRVVGRDFKVLYYLARKQEWKVSLRHLLYLIQEARRLMPLEWVTGPLLDLYRQEFDLQGVPSRLPEKACVYTMMGEMFEEVDNLDNARRWYERAITASPTKSGYWKLCKILHSEGHFDLCISSWEDSLRCPDTASVLDLTPVSETGTKVFVAHALSMVGRHNEAVDMITDVQNKCPQPGVTNLKRVIETRALGTI